MCNFSVPATSAGLRWIKGKLSPVAVKCEHHTSKAKLLGMNTTATAGLASQPHITLPLPIFLLHIQLHTAIILKIKSKSLSTFALPLPRTTHCLYSDTLPPSQPVAANGRHLSLSLVESNHLLHKRWKSTMIICFFKGSVSLYLCRILILINVCVYNSNIFAVASINQEFGESPCRNNQETNNNP